MIVELTYIAVVNLNYLSISYKSPTDAADNCMSWCLLIIYWIIPCFKWSNDDAMVILVSYFCKTFVVLIKISIHSHRIRLLLQDFTEELYDATWRTMNVSTYGVNTLGSELVYRTTLIPPQWTVGFDMRMCNNYKLDSKSSSSCYDDE